VKCLIFLLVVLNVTAARAGDLGFRFNGAACVNAQGKTGLNPGFFGPCGDLQHISVNGLPLDGTDLTGAVFDGSDFSTTSFNGAILDYASFKGTNLTGTNLMNAQIHSSNLQGAILVNAKMANADIKSSDFTKANFTGVALSLLDLSGSKFSGVNFTGAALDGTNFSNAELTSTLFANANLQGAVLDGATLNSANFMGADLTKGSLKGAKGTNVSFSGTLLHQAALDGADFEVSNFRGAQMDNTTMNKATFEESDMRSAVLQGADVSDANVKGVRINRSTVLPISLDQAIALGMYIDTSGNMLFIGNSTDSGLIAFVGALQKLNVDVTVASELEDSFAGDMDLTDYTAIFVAGGYSADMPTAGQTSILAFLKNGGTVLTTISANYAMNEYGYLASWGDLDLMTYSGTNVFLSGAITIADPSNPYFNGISTTDFANEVYNQASLANFGTNPANALMSLGSYPLVATRQVGTGLVINLNFCPVGNEECWTDRQFAKLVSNMVNAAYTAQKRRMTLCF